MKRWMCGQAYRMGIISWYAMTVGGTVTNIGWRGSRTWCRQYGWMSRVPGLRDTRPGDNLR